MKTKSLLAVLVAIALLGGRVFGAEETSIPTATASVAKVVRTPGMEKAPVVVKKIMPEYPQTLRGYGIQGVATVDLLVDSSGRVVEATLVRSTNPEFARPALEAAKAWTFEPALAKNGQAITTRVRVSFEFVTPQLAAD